MRILLVNPNKIEREAHAKFLEGKNHRVESACDLRSVLHQLEGGPFQSVYIDSVFQSDGAHEMLDGIRTRCPESARPHVLLGIDRAQVAFDELYQAGADDFIRRPLWKEELAARLETPTRVRAAQVDDTRINPLAQPGWLDMSTVFAASMAGFASAGIDVDREARPPQDPVVAASLSLTMPAHDAEIRVVAIISVASLRALAKQMLEASMPSEALLQDLLGELVNTAAGALKRAAPDVALTTGLPCQVPNAELVQRWGKASVRTSVRFRGSAISVAFAVSVITQKTQRLAANLLREGMVLTKDVRNDAGLLLVPSGTRLTSTSADRVANLLGAERLVEILCAA